MRVFIAALIDSETLLLLKRCQESLKPIWKGVRWERPEKFHITLKFLGYVDDSGIGRVARITEEAVRTLHPMRMRLKGAGCFPSVERPRIVCFCLEENGDGDLGKAQSRIERGLTTLGYAPESRPFTPHITVGRVKRKAASLRGTLPSMDDVEFLIKDITVIRSDTLPEGSQYTTLNTFELG